MIHVVVFDGCGVGTALVDGDLLRCTAEQDHRAIKRMTRPMLGFKSFWSAAITLAGIEIMHMIRKGQLICQGTLTPAQHFYSLAE